MQAAELLDVACDHCHRHPEDVALLRGLAAAHHLLVGHGLAVGALRAAGAREVGVTLNPDFNVPTSDSACANRPRRPAGSSRGSVPAGRPWLRAPQVYRRASRIASYAGLCARFSSQGRAAPSPGKTAGIHECLSE